MLVGVTYGESCDTFLYRTLLPSFCYTEIHGGFTETPVCRQAGTEILCRNLLVRSDSFVRSSKFQHLSACRQTGISLCLLCALCVTDFGLFEKVSGSEFLVSFQGLGYLSLTIAFYNK